MERHEALFPALHRFPCSQRLVRHNVATLRSQFVCRRLDSNRVHSVRLVDRKCLPVIEVLVDNTAHALLAVVAVRLTAVVPERLLVLHEKRENVVGLATWGCEVETGEDARSIGERLAWLVE